MAVFTMHVFSCVCVLNAVNSLGPFKKQIRLEVQTATQAQQRHRTKKLNLHFLLFIHSACLVKRDEWGDVTSHTNQRTQRTAGMQNNYRKTCCRCIKKLKSADILGNDGLFSLICISQHKRDQALLQDSNISILICCSQVLLVSLEVIIATK